MQREFPLAGEGDECTEEGVDRRTWDFSLSTCLGAHWEAHKTILLVGPKRRIPERQQKRLEVEGGVG